MRFKDSYKIKRSNSNSHRCRTCSSYGKNIENLQTIYVFAMQRGKEAQSSSSIPTTRPMPPPWQLSALAALTAMDMTTAAAKNEHFSVNDISYW